MPLIKHGKYVAVFSVHQTTSRMWTPAEIVLIEETAERTWSAVERARAEAALVESEEKYRELIKYASAGIYERDLQSNYFLSVNDLMCQLTGYKRKELLEMNPLDLLDDRSKMIYQKRASQRLNGEEPDQKVDYKVRTKDGREIFVSLNTSYVIRDKNGKPQVATVIVHDITERKHAEAKLRESEERQVFYSS